MLRVITLCFFFLVFQQQFTTTVVLQSFNVHTNSKKNCDSIPELNLQIRAYITTKLHKKVGTGECWDLAAECLNTVKANWDNNYKFGHTLNPEKDCIYPGDIVQFEKVKIEYWNNKTRFRENLVHHTAVVYECINEGEFTLAEQNTTEFGKKVGLGKLYLKSVLQGKLTFYRPFK